MELEKIQQFIMDTVEECSFEIESDYTEEELKQWDRVKVLEYLIEFLDFERQSWERKYASKKPQKQYFLLPTTWRLRMFEQSSNPLQLN